MPSLYSCRAGTSWTIVKADNPAHARQLLGERLGFEHKPYLWRTIEVRRATKADVESYGALADAGRSTSKKASSARKPRERTAKRLIDMVGQGSLLDDSA